MKIKISNKISFPIDIVTQTVAIVAKRRVGKSFTMRKMVEQLFYAKQQVVIVDPKGDQWGVRSSADGKKKGLPIMILGGEHGDVPLEANAGEVVAKLVVEERVSVLLDLSLFRKSEVAVFMTAFLENIYRLKAKEQYRTAMMLVIDEADAIAPQRPQHGEERMLGAAEDIVRRGGQRGIGCVLVTQRTAVLNKNVLTQAQLLIALRTIAPQDLAAMNAWIDVHGTQEQKKTLMESLPSLPVGDAWFWSPGWPDEEGVFQRDHVLPIDTFDSGATPRAGEVQRKPKTMADIDLDAVKKQMAGTIEKMKADDPKALKAKIAALEKELSKKPKVDDGELARHQIAFGTVENAYKLKIKEYNDWFDGLQSYLMNHPWPKPDVGAKYTGKIPDYTPTKEEKKLFNLVNDAVRSAEDRFVNEQNASLGKGEKQILIAIAQHEQGISREHLTILTGYKRSSRDAYIQRLRTKGYLNFAGDFITATKEGIEALGSDYEILPTGAALREKLLRELPEGEKKVLGILIEAYPNAVEREAISNAVNYQRSSRDAYIQRLKARQLIELEGRGMVKAAEKLFD